MHRTLSRPARRSEISPRQIDATFGFPYRKNTSFYAPHTPLLMNTYHCNTIQCDGWTFTFDASVNLAYFVLSLINFWLFWLVSSFFGRSAKLNCLASVKVFLHSWHFAAVVYKNAYLSFVNSLLCCVSIGANDKWINLRVPILKKCPKMHPNLFQTIFKMHALSCCVTIDVCDKSVH